LKFTVIDRISLSDIMLNYHLIEILISVMYSCNTLTTNSHHSNHESHMINQSSSQAALPQEDLQFYKEAAQCHSFKH